MTDDHLAYRGPGDEVWDQVRSDAYWRKAQIKALKGGYNCLWDRIQRDRAWALQCLFPGVVPGEYRVPILNRAIYFATQGRDENGVALLSSGRRAREAVYRARGQTPPRAAPREDEGELSGSAEENLRETAEERAHRRRQDYASRKYKGHRLGHAEEGWQAGEACL